MRISDWSADVCTSDLRAFVRSDAELGAVVEFHQRHRLPGRARQQPVEAVADRGPPGRRIEAHACDALRVRLRDAAAQRQAIDRDLQPRRGSEEHTSELQSLMRISYAAFCLKKKRTHNTPQ